VPMSPAAASDPTKILLVARLSIATASARGHWSTRTFVRGILCGLRLFTLGTSVLVHSAWFLPRHCESMPLPAPTCNHKMHAIHIALHIPPRSR
jgi:hypothetical protein